MITQNPQTGLKAGLGACICMAPSKDPPGPVRRGPVRTGIGRRQPVQQPVRAGRVDPVAAHDRVPRRAVRLVCCPPAQVSGQSHIVGRLVRHCGSPPVRGMVRPWFGPARPLVRPVRCAGPPGPCPAGDVELGKPIRAGPVHRVVRRRAGVVRGADRRVRCEHCKVDHRAEHGRCDRAHRDHHQPVRAGTVRPPSRARARCRPPTRRAMPGPARGRNGGPGRAPGPSTPAAPATVSSPAHMSTRGITAAPLWPDRSAQPTHRPRRR